MCLAVPGKIVRWISRDPVLATAEVEFEGVRRVCHMACVTEAAVGDYVIVHAGVGISRIKERFVTDFPDPDSPTMPSDCPAANSKLTSSTAFTTPSSVSK